MKRALSALLLLCAALSLCACGGGGAIRPVRTTPKPAAPAQTEDRVVPEGTPLFEPGCEMALDFGSFTVLDAGFAGKVSYYTDDGAEKKADALGADGGSTLFAVKGRLRSAADAAVELRTLQPVLRYGKGETIIMQGFPARASGESAPKTLEPGGELFVIFTCKVPSSLYFGDTDILFTLAGGTLGLRRSSLKSYASMGFRGQDGVQVGDVTALSDEESETHTDELSVKEAWFAYDEARMDYKLTVQIHNRYQPEEGQREPNRIHLRFRFLSINGEPLAGQKSAAELLFRDVPCGEDAEASAHIKKELFDDAVFFEIGTYVLEYAEGPKPDWELEGTLTEPVFCRTTDLTRGRLSDLRTTGGVLYFENVTLHFTPGLPDSITSSDAFRGSGNRSKNDPTGEELYAAIRFSVTNYGKQEINLTAEDLGFDIKLSVDGVDICSVNDGEEAFFQAAKNVTLVSKDFRLNPNYGIRVGPLVTEDVNVFLRCPGQAETDKPAAVSFLVNGKWTDFPVR